MSSKVVIGIVVGGVLGLLDGLTALFYPDAAPLIMSIVAGSTIKGLVTGLIAGFVARKYRSLPLGLGVGLVVGLILAFLAASVSPDTKGNYHYFAIMLPGGLVGLIVGFATQRFGRTVAPAQVEP